MHRLHRQQPEQDAISLVPRHGSLCRNRCRRRRLQKRRRKQAQARRNALDRQRRQRHHRAALRHSEQPLRRLLGATRNRRMTEISQICRAPTRPCGNVLKSWNASLAGTAASLLRVTGCRSRGPSPGQGASAANRADRAAGRPGTRARPCAGPTRRTMSRIIIRRTVRAAARRCRLRTGMKAMSQDRSSTCRSRAPLRPRNTALTVAFAVIAARQHGRRFPQA